ncbi:dTMP kinase [Buchnera aphidicola]|uniref:dTMP kinase n=1 Tax=Buchnera aphidicola TaxID=9 RepID=UPI0031B817DD
MNFLDSKFIAIEGLDGSGKTHSINIIKKIFNQYQIPYIIVREPGSTPLSEKIRKIIKNDNIYENINKKTILLLIYAARMQLIENLIQPALKNNIWVIADRYVLSSYAYQGGGFKIHQSIIQQINKIVVKKLLPHLTIYLDVIPKIGLQRVLRRGNIDAIEKNNLNFFIRIRNMYLKYIKKNKNIIKINANLKKNIVHENIKNTLIKWLKKCI